MKNLAISFFSAIFLFLSSDRVRAQDNMLGSIDALTTVALYNSYLAIGSIGDGYSFEYYAEADVISFMDEQITLMQLLDEQLKKLAGSGEILNEEDIAFLNEESSIFSGLQRQASYLKDYVSNGYLDSDLEAYDAQRVQNWDDISKLLGLE